MSGYTLIQARGRPPAPPSEPEGLDRREALAWMAAGSAALMGGCSGKPPAQVLPYLEQPEGLASGEARRYATTVTLAGYDRGVVGICHDGRPTKLEGSPRHPASLGATDVFAEAEVLSLYDPARLRTPETADGPLDWADFAAAWAPRLDRARARGGDGFTLVTGRITSPTELRLIERLRTQLPGMRWRRFEAVHDDAAREGARLAFGHVLDARPRLAECAVVLCLDADPLGPGPDQAAQGRAFTEARRPERRPFLRLYAAEPGWSLTGMNADHRLPLRAGDVAALGWEVARRLGVGGQEAAPPLPPAAGRFAEAVAADLARAPGRALVLVGRNQPATLHALAHAINARLGAPVALSPPVDPHPDDHAASLRALADDLRAGRVETLVTVGVDPVHQAPPGLGLAEAVARVPWSAAAALAPDDTVARHRWRLPLAHPLESWGDGRAPDGTAALRQPLVRPLHAGRSAAELLALLAGEPAAEGQALVRATWADRGDGEAFEAWWREALTAGLIAGSAPAPLGGPAARPPPRGPAAAAGGLELTFSPDPSLWDGRFAGNAWLQECPRPLTHEVWGASLAVAPEDARRLGVGTGDHLRLEAAGGGRVEAPVRVTSGQAAGAVTAFLGGGRREAGPVGSGVGWNVAALRPLGPRAGDAPEVLAVTAERVTGRAHPPTFSETRRLDGEARKLSPVLAVGAAVPAEALDRDLRPPSLYPDPPAHTPAWAMVIDAAACIGCNACVVACQAENNVPVVGPREVARGRDMHWLRIDAYEVDGRPAFQPVPCMHCEHAPCEPVCPVEASVHDHEGLNAQVYNRCIGTRFCQANCPYKVRRFNFHGYAHEQAYADTGAEDYAGQKNPDVTVRGRGVMEKCTYCVQRLSGARRAAEREGRPIRPEDAATACQNACPTRAIRFGDLHAPGSEVAALRRDGRHYALLGELGTRPRTTYLARLRNPNPALEDRA